MSARSFRITYYHLLIKVFIQLFIEPTTTITDLSKRIIEFKNRIHLFHYAGHADSEQLMLRDQTADAGGIAQLLAIQKNLKLVFLNGCSTQDQVALLLSLGIPAVIATSVPIEDPSALEFANMFYGALGREHTIQESFDIAAANHQAKTGDRPSIFRGLDLNENQTTEMPWGLYINPDLPHALDWKIPRQSASSFIIRNAGMSYGRQVSMNKKLVETIANTIEPYSESVQSLVREAKRRQRSPSLRDLRVAIIDAFPTPLGTHLRKLLLSEEISTKRLQNIVNVYSIATQMLGYVLLAQLWDEKHQNESFFIPEAQQSVIRQFYEYHLPVL